MRANRLNLIILVAFTFLFFISCDKKTEEFTSEPLSDYLPVQVGKYITYKLDSTVFTNFGQGLEVHSYQEKLVVDEQIPDASGRPGYRILRFIRDVAGTKPWAPAGTFFIVPSEKTIEIVENNLRFIKLALPLKKGFTWKGNQYLPSEPYAGMYSFNNDNSMSKWDYTIDSVNSTINLNGNTLSNVLKVIGNNENNIADTVTVKDTTALIKASMKTAYLRGTATGVVKVTAEPPTYSGKLDIYNRLSWPVILDTIVIPPNTRKSFEYINKKWTYGYVDDFGKRKDTAYTDLPYGARDVLIEKYAKGIGLVQQEYILWEYQYTQGSSNGGVTNGFEVRRTMIDHN